MRWKSWTLFLLVLGGVAIYPALRAASAQTPAAQPPAAQTPGAATPANAISPGDLRFEVVSIKKNIGPGGSMSSQTLPNGGHLAINMPVRNLISAAYAPVTIDVSSLPAWAGTEGYDVNAASPLTGTATAAQRQAMMRAMLVERFNFKARFEPRETDAFDLVLATKDGRLGPNMTPSSGNCDAREREARAAAGAATGPTLSVNPPAPQSSCAGRLSGGVLEGEFTVSSMLFYIRMMAGKPVTDRTGLKGSYNVRLETSSRVGGGTDQAPDIFAALPSQLGLKLEPAKVMVDTLVVETMERPSEN
jgi:uncharacterized protein (TIGR03435 family)